MQLPPLRCTYIQAFELYRRSFISVLPFLLLLVLGEFLINYFFPAGGTLNWSVIYRSLADMAITALIFSLILKLIYIKNVTQNAVTWALEWASVKRIIHVFLAYFIATLPLLLSLSGLVYYEANYAEYVLTPEVITKKQYLYLGVLALGFIFTLIFYTFSFIAGVYIVIKDENVATSLRRSWHLIRSCWLDTLLVIVILGMIAVTLALVFDILALKQSSYLITLLLSSFYPSLMIVRFNQITHLERE